MNKQEFEERTGAKTTYQEFEEIAEIYLNAGEMDKDEFCSNWKTKDGRLRIMKALSDKVNGCRSLYDKVVCEKAELVETQNRMVDILLDNQDADTIREITIALLGSEREYIRCKCERGLPLDADDKAAILRLL